jgi:hypothetical protein
MIGNVALKGGINHDGVCELVDLRQDGVRRALQFRDGTVKAWRLKSDEVDAQ